MLRHDRRSIVTFAAVCRAGSTSSERRYHGNHPISVFAALSCLTIASKGHMSAQTSCGRAVGWRLEYSLCLCPCKETLCYGNNSIGKAHEQDGNRGRDRQRDRSDEEAGQRRFRGHGRSDQEEPRSSRPRRVHRPWSDEAHGRAKPATKARKGINPFTARSHVQAKPARNIVKIRPLKNLKDMV